MRFSKGLAASVTCATGICALVCDLSFAGDAPKHKPFPPQVRKAWQKAGFSFGTMVGPFHFSLDAIGGISPEEMPHFQAPEEWKAGIIANLPHPVQPFGLDLSRSPVGDDVLREVAKLRTLARLYVDASALTAGGLKHLAGSEGLEAITFIGGKITGDGVACLSQVKNLRQLVFMETEVAEENFDRLIKLSELRFDSTALQPGLKMIGRLPRLTDLYFRPWEFKKGDFRDIAGFANLRKLDVSYTKVTDADLEHIVRLRDLVSLALDSTKVTNAGLKHLDNLANLQELSLHDTAVTDEGLKHLVRLKNLKEIDLYNTQVTDDGVAALQKALPKVKINRVSKRKGEIV